MADFSEVLIVDDSSTSRMIIQRCIDMAGFSVGSCLFAEDGLDAVALIRERPGLSLVITDINMPKMDGQTLVRLVRGDPLTAGIPLVVVSSIARADAEGELFALGVQAVVKKPVSPEKMLKALASVREGGAR